MVKVVSEEGICAVMLGCLLKASIVGALVNRHLAFLHTTLQSVDLTMSKIINILPKA